MKSGETHIAELATSTGDALRRMALDLHPLELDLLGLTAALNQHIETLDRRSTADITLSVEGKPYKDTLPNDVALTAYRVCQEAISNAIKHGRPRHVDVKMVWEPRLLTLQVDDDGVGFDPDQIETDPPPLGLTSMRERTHLAKGSLILSSRVGGGTAIWLELPLPEVSTSASDANTNISG